MCNTSFQFYNLAKFGWISTRITKDRLSDAKAAIAKSQFLVQSVGIPQLLKKINCQILCACVCMCARVRAHTFTEILSHFLLKCSETIRLEAETWLLKLQPKFCKDVRKGKQVFIIERVMWPYSDSVTTSVYKIIQSISMWSSLEPIP